MAEFSRGVKEYVFGTATVCATFPVDLKGNADVCCAQCAYYRRSSKMCSLTRDICEYPDHYIGSKCPLEFYTAAEWAEKGDRT